MGLFSKPKQQVYVPEPTLLLSLTDQADKVFKPNDTVSGHVTITTPSAITPRTIEVSLWGESTTWIRTESTHKNSATNTSSTDYTHYRDNAPLFAVTCKLLPEPYQFVQGQAYTFPFSFRVPEGTGFNRTGCYKDANDSRWTALPHNLPPSFVFGNPESPDTCSISYGVTATLVRASLGEADPTCISSTTPILFHPFNTTALLAPGPLPVLHYPQTFTLASSALTGLDPAALGFRKRMHDKLSSSTPKLDFELCIDIPDVLATGTEFRFRTTFDVKAKTETVTHVPAIEFKVLKLQLLLFTSFRAPRDWDASNTMSGYHRTSSHRVPKKTMGSQGQEHSLYRETKVPLNTLPDTQVVELSEVQQVEGGGGGGEGGEGDKKGSEQDKLHHHHHHHCEHWWTARVPGTTPPSFQSFAITRQYRVKVEVGVQIAGKKFALKTESHVRDLGSVVGENGV